MNHFKLIRESLHFSGIFLINYLDCGYEETIYSAIEVGKVKPSQFLIDNICETFHVNRKWFIDESEEVLVDKKRVRPSKADVLERLSDVKDTGLTTFSFILNKAGVESTVLYRDSNLSTKTVRKLAEAANVGFEWLLWGEENARVFPVNDTLISFLYSHEDLRKNLWFEMGRRPLVTAGLDGEDILSRIEKIRAVVGMNKKDFSTMIGLSERYLWKKNSNINNMHLSSIHMIADNVGVGWEWIKYGDRNNKYYPCDRYMKTWLKENPYYRKEIWKEIGKRLNKP